MGVLTEAGAEELFWELLRKRDRPSELLAAGTDVATVRAALEAVPEVDDLVIERVSVNVGRVDVDVQAPRDQWRVVYFVDGAGLVESAEAWCSPPRFEGVEGGRAVVINGPSGAGKSSLMQAVLDADPRPWVMFDEPWLGTVRQPYLIWGDAAPRLIEGFLDGIAAVAANGNLVLVSAGGVSFEVISEAFRGVPTLVVGLKCSIDTLIERERGRQGRRGGLAEASMEGHGDWRYDLMLDTTDLPSGHLARLVLDAVGRMSSDDVR